MGLSFAGTDRSQLDFSQCMRDTAGFEARLQQLIETHAPTHLLISAAYTAVDKAQTEPELARAVNATALGCMGAVARQFHLPVVHFSTDYVFNGQRPLEQRYHPTDPIDPQSVYGQTKAAGEQALLASGAQAVVFRTSWVFSAHGANFVKTMLRLAQERNHLKVVSDQVGAPTSAEWLAEATLEACAALRAEHQGVYHLTASGSVSWHGFAQALLAEARLQAPQRAWTIQSNDQIEAITTEQFNAPAPRPRNSQLDCSSTEADFQIKRPAWQDQMRAVLKALLP